MFSGLDWFGSLITTMRFSQGRRAEGFPLDEAPRYLIRGRDRIYGGVVTRRLLHLGYPGQLLHGFALAERLRRMADRISSSNTETF
jgi:hypothetical protein